MIEAIELLYDCQHLPFIQEKLIFSLNFLYVCICLLFQRTIILCKNVWDISVVVTSLSLALADKFLEGTLSTLWDWGRLNFVEGNLSQWTVLRACLLQDTKNKWFECEAYFFTQRMTWSIMDCIQTSFVILFNVLCICIHFLPKCSPNFSGIYFSFKSEYNI